MTGQIVVYAVALVIGVGIMAFACFSGLALIKLGRRSIGWSETRFGGADEKFIALAEIAGGGFIIALGALAPFVEFALVWCSTHY